MGNLKLYFNKFLAASADGFEVLAIICSIYFLYHQFRAIHPMLALWQGEFWAIPGTLLLTFSQPVGFIFSMISGLFILKWSFIDTLALLLPIIPAAILFWFAAFLRPIGNSAIYEKILARL